MSSDNFPHDAAYKTFFSNPDMVKSLIKDFIPEEFVASFDFATLEECPNSYVTSVFNRRENDVVWRARWRGSWCYIYILLEFQSSSDYWMPLRLLTYTFLLWESLVRNKALKLGDKLPPVFPIVVYNGEGIWKADTNIHNLISTLDERLSEYQPTQKYFLIDINKLPSALLNKVKGESAFIFRLEKAKTPEEIKIITHEIGEYLKEPSFAPLRKSIYNWITLLLSKRGDQKQKILEKEVEDFPMLEQTIDRWADELIEKGIQKGRLLGKEEGMLLGKEEGMLLGKEEGKILGKQEGLNNQKKTLLEMLSDRFGAVPQDWLNIIDNINETGVISRLTRDIYKVKTDLEFKNLLSQFDEEGRSPYNSSL